MNIINTKLTVISISVLLGLTGPALVLAATTSEVAGTLGAGVSATTSSEVTGTIGGDNPVGGSITGNVTGGSGGGGGGSSRGGSRGNSSNNPGGEVLGASTDGVGNPAFPNAGEYTESPHVSTNVLMLALASMSFFLLFVTRGKARMF